MVERESAARAPCASMINHGTADAVGFSLFVRTRATAQRCYNGRYKIVARGGDGARLAVRWRAPLAPPSPPVLSARAMGGPQATRCCMAAPSAVVVAAVAAAEDAADPCSVS